MELSGAEQTRHNDILIITTQVMVVFNVHSPPYHNDVLLLESHAHMYVEREYPNKICRIIQLGRGGENN